MGLIDYVGTSRKPSRALLLKGIWPAWIANNKRAKYIAQVVLSAPPWVDRTALKAIQAEARAKTIATGELHVVAHRIPLNHPRVCGLTVPWNLKVKPWRVNASEGNHFCPEQMEMFDVPDD